MQNVVIWQCASGHFTSCPPQRKFRTSCTRRWRRFWARIQFLWTRSHSLGKHLQPDSSNLFSVTMFTHLDPAHCSFESTDALQHLQRITVESSSTFPNMVTVFDKLSLIQFPSLEQILPAGPQRDGEDCQVDPHRGSASGSGGQSWSAHHPQRGLWFPAVYSSSALCLSITDRHY